MKNIAWIVADCGHSVTGLMTDRLSDDLPSGSGSDSPDTTNDSVSPQSTVTKRPEKLDPIETYFCERGFDRAMVVIIRDKYKLRTVDDAHARVLIETEDGHYKGQSLDGLYFPFSNQFGQLRPFTPVTSKGKPAKYLTTQGVKIEDLGTKAIFNWKAQPKVITEGVADSIAGTEFGRITTGAIAGVTHWKAIPVDWDGVLLYDSDASLNPKVWGALIEAGIARPQMKLQFLPAMADEHAGLSEYFMEYSPEDYSDLLNKAMRPKELLLYLITQWGGLEKDKLRENADKAIRYAHLLNEGDRLLLIETIEGYKKGITKGYLRERLKQQQKDWTAEKVAAKKTSTKEKAKAKKGKWMQFEFPSEYDPSTEKLTCHVPAHSLIADGAVEYYNGKTLYDATIGAYWRYDGKIWKETSEAKIYAELLEHLKQGFYAAGGEDDQGISHGSMAGAMTMLQKQLNIEEPQTFWEQAEGLPFQNGLLNLATGELEPYSPEHRMRRILPCDYVEDATLTTDSVFWKFAIESLGYCEGKLQVIRAWLNQALKGSNPYQKFLHLHGKPNTGKTTWLNICTALTGLDNRLSVQVGTLDKQRFTLGELPGKALVTDSEVPKFVESVEILKALTGASSVIVERKNKAATSQVWAGNVLLCSNHPFKCPAVDIEAIERRIISIHFNTFPKQINHNLLDISNNQVRGDIVAEFPAIVRWVLAMPQDEVKHTLENYLDVAPSLALDRQEEMAEASTVGSWLMSGRVAWSETEGTRTGSRNGDVMSELYANFQAYCDENGYKASNSNNFKRELVDAAAVVWRDFPQLPKAKQVGPKTERAKGVSNIVIHTAQRNQHPFKDPSLWDIQGQLADYKALKALPILTVSGVSNLEAQGAHLEKPMNTEGVRGERGEQPILKSDSTGKKFLNESNKGGNKESNLHIEREVVQVAHPAHLAHPQAQQAFQGVQPENKAAHPAHPEAPQAFQSLPPQPPDKKEKTQTPMTPRGAGEAEVVTVAAGMTAAVSKGDIERLARSFPRAIMDAAFELVTEDCRQKIYQLMC